MDELEKAVGKQMARDLVSLFGLTAHEFAPISLDEIEPDEPNPKQFVIEPCNTMLDYGSRDARRKRADFFMKHVASGHVAYPVIKACTWSGGHKLSSESWLGITWVAVQGTDSLCVVVRNNDLLHLARKVVDWDNLHDTHGISHFHKLFWNIIVSEVEGIEERIFGQSCLRPFSVFTVGATGEDSISGHEDSLTAMYRAEQTSNFLREKLKSNPSLSSEKLVQTAIMATQHLFDKEFDADELRVLVWETSEIIGKELLQKRENPDLEELLASLDESDNDDPDTRYYKSRRVGARHSHASPTPPGEHSLMMLEP